ncbi:MAG: beta-phosphoglucomutase family hydrolase [Oscillochloris sp.]|nr:beta-phosphoglucomutase family hydrolase [Oscillochloris sp.]
MSDDHFVQRIAKFGTYDAWLFDLDGVITGTSMLHAAAWQQMFNSFLSAWAQRSRAPFQPFEINPDYYRYVDGKPRYEGVAAFLQSRNIIVARGKPSDSPALETICGLGNRKNHTFNELLHRQGANVYPDSINLLTQLRRAGHAIAVVTSSRNCATVLKSAGLDTMFDTQIDGISAAAEGLAGKPAPDTFLAAAQQLGVAAEQCVVIEDAVAGVQAGRNGGFGLVIGVARNCEPELLRAGGADLVVANLNELELN